MIFLLLLLRVTLQNIAYYILEIFSQENAIFHHLQVCKSIDESNVQLPTCSSGGQFCL